MRIKILVSHLFIHYQTQIIYYTLSLNNSIFFLYQLFTNSNFNSFLRIEITVMLRCIQMFFKSFSDALRAEDDRDVNFIKIVFRLSSYKTLLVVCTQISSMLLSTTMTLVLFLIKSNSFSATTKVEFGRFLSNSTIPE